MCCVYCVCCTDTCKHATHPTMEVSLEQSIPYIDLLDKELDDDYEHKVAVAEWKLVQEHVCLAMKTSYDGMVSTVDVDKSYREHKKCLVDKGYAFGKYKTDRSYFEKLDRCFQGVQSIVNAMLPSPTCGHLIEVAHILLIVTL